MKKNFLFVMAAAAMLASCSKDAAVSEPAGTGNENGVVDPTDPNSPVKIVLGASNVDASVEVDKKASRAPITTWNATEVGIFALAKNATYTGWQQDDGSILLENVKGTIQTGTDSQVIEIGDHYYPSSNENFYTFCGYYPYADALPVIDTETSVITTTYTIDGSQDIMWGQAAVTTPLENTDGEGTLDGYNALYMRKGNGAAAPDIKFDHLLTQLNFNIKKAGDFQSVDGKQLKVTKIQVNTYNSLDLTIADKATIGSDVTDKTTVIKPTADAQEAYIPVIKDDTGVKADAVVVDDITGSQAFGTSMMLYTAGDTQTSYTIKVTLQLGDDTENESAPIDITLTGDAAFKPSNAYNVNITVNGVTEITVNATLGKWVPAGESADIEIN